MLPTIVYTLSRVLPRRAYVTWCSAPERGSHFCWCAADIDWEAMAMGNSAGAATVEFDLRPRVLVTGKRAARRRRVQTDNDHEGRCFGKRIGRI